MQRNPVQRSKKAGLNELHKLAIQNQSLLGQQSARREIADLLAAGNSELHTKIEATLAAARIEEDRKKAVYQEKAEAAEKAAYKTLEKSRKQSQVLEAYEAQEKKLNDLLLQNDRPGVRKMLEAYLPWPVMEPLEKQMWKVWLEAIEHPDTSKTIVALRGISYDTDKMQRLKLPNGEDRLAFMSSVLTKNQGTIPPSAVANYES